MPELNVRNADNALYFAIRFLEQRSKIGAGCAWPVQFARQYSLSWLESELALRLAVEIGCAIRRSDGRYFYKNPEAAR